MTPPRPIPATVVLAAAAASIPPSNGAPTPPCTSSWNYLTHRSNTIESILQLPRGGSSSTESTTKTDGEAHNKHKKKKKRGKKPDKEKETTIDEPTTDTNPSDNDTSSILPPEISHILSTTCHYSVLGLPKSASSTEILKAYRKKCVLTHPDKLPPHISDRRGAFDKVSKAYDVLSCEKKRALYDRFGHDGDNVSAMGAHSDMFKDFFGFHDPFFGRRSFSGNTNPFRRPPRNKDLRYNLEVTLEDLYTGTTKNVAIQQPNPIQPHFPLRKELSIPISPGMANGNSIKVSGVVDSIPDASPADVVFYLSERRHEVFTRRGCDLAMEIKISLGESVGGFSREIKCLDGSLVVVCPPRGELVERKSDNATSTLSEDINGTDVETIQLPSAIIQSGDVHVLKGKGMPVRTNHGTPQQYGNLYIQYVVEMPDTKQNNNLSGEEKLELARLLHKLEGKDILIPTFNSNSEVHHLEPAMATDFGKSHPNQPSHDEQDDDSHSPTNDLNDFFQRAFGARSSFGSFGNGGGFHYFSSKGGFGYDGPRGEEEHKVECNQM